MNLMVKLLATGTAIAALTAAGCSRPAAPSSPSGSGTTPTATATPSATPAPPRPYAVVLTNAQRTGTTYDILLVDLAGQIVARATAELPTQKVGELGLEIPLISASDTAVYYLDGNTDIRSLSPSGTTADVMSIPGGATAELIFAVSPDDQRIAVAELTERSDPSKDSSKAYVEDLGSGSNRVWLWKANLGASATRGPIGWHGSSLIDAIYPNNQCPTTQCPLSAPLSAITYGSGYHVFDPVTGNVSARVCDESKTYPYWFGPVGLPTAYGTACDKLQGESVRLTVVGWSGAEHLFLQDARQAVGSTLSPDGTRIACLGGPSGLAIVTSDGTLTDVDLSTTTTEGVIPWGWIDPTHLLAYLDKSDAAVIDPDSAAVTKVPLPNAEDAFMAASLPGVL